MSSSLTSYTLYSNNSRVTTICKLFFLRHAKSYFFRLHKINDSIIICAKYIGARLKNTQGLKKAKRMLGCQLLITLLVALLALAGKGLTAGLSALLGGLVSVIPNAYFATQLFSHHGAQAAKKIVRGFYKGEAAKLFLTMILFALVFKFVHIVPWLFFAVYIAVQMVLWFAPLIFNSKTK